MMMTPEIRRLIDSWRQEAAAIEFQKPWGALWNHPNVVEAKSLRYTADQLEAALLAASPQRNPDDFCTCGHRRESHHVWGRCHGLRCKCTAFILADEGLAASPVPPPKPCDPQCGAHVSTWHVPHCPNAPDWLASPVLQGAEPQPCATCGHSITEHNMTGLGECYAPLGPHRGICQCEGWTGR